jgi:hypothetical protein
MKDFWARQKTLEDEFESTIEVGSSGHCLIFAEFMHKSWWYAVKFSKYGEGYEIGIVSSADKFKLITRSLGEFIQLYMKDASVLYEY